MQTTMKPLVVLLLLAAVEAITCDVPTFYTNIFDTQTVDGLDDLNPSGYCTTVNGSLDLSALDGWVDLGPLETITGNLTVKSSSSMNVLQMSALETVEGDLTIESNPALATVNMSALQTVGNNLTINGNTLLADVDMSALQTVGNNLQIRNNKKLVDVDMSALETVGNDLQIRSSSSMNVLQMSALEKVEGDLTIESNPALATVNMSALQTVGNNLTINGNTLLADVDMSALQTVGNNLQIRNNQKTLTFLSCFAVDLDSGSCKGLDELKAVQECSSTTVIPTTGKGEGEYPCLSTVYVDKMKKDITDRLASYELAAATLDEEDVEKYYARADFVGGVARLTFHDAGTYSLKDNNGGPDGCLDLDEADNGGLAAVIEDVDTLYEPHKARLSKADYWVLIANTVMNELDVEKRSSATLNLKFRYGRADRKECKAMDMGRLPAADKGWDHLWEVFGERMGFTAEEIVALSGAHTLGRCELDNSGFVGPWVIPTRAATMDTQYFIGLVTTPWAKQENSKGNPQWNFDVAAGVKQQMLLNTDAALLFTNADQENCKKFNSGEVSHGECVKNDVAWEHVQAFQSATNWFPAFEKALHKMQELGYPEGSLLAPGECFGDKKILDSEVRQVSSSAAVSASLAFASILVLAQIM